MVFKVAYDTRVTTRTHIYVQADSEERLRSVLNRIEKEICISNVNELIDCLNSLDDKVSVFICDIRQTILDEEEPEFYDLQEI